MANVEPLPTSLSTEIDPPVHIDDPLRDRKAQSGAAVLARPRFVSPPEAIEDVRQVLGIDADARI